MHELFREKTIFTKKLIEIISLNLALVLLRLWQTFTTYIYIGFRLVHRTVFLVQVILDFLSEFFFQVVNLS